VSVQFVRLQVSGWRQFGDVDLDLSARLTVITGANGAGKTTLVTVLGRHFNWQSQFLGIPVRTDSGDFRYWSSVRDSGSSPSVLGDGWAPIGRLTYSNGTVTELSMSENAGISSDVHLPQQQAVPGLFLSSHRTLSSYQQVQSLPAQFNESEQILEQYLHEIRQRYSGGYTQKTTMLLMKEALLASAIYRSGNDAVESSQEAAEVWDGYQECLRLLLPQSMRFQRLSVRPPEIIVETGTGDFMIDAVSGGLSALLDVGWQIYLRSRRYSDFTVCMDEPENHLHPSLQRSILPSLLAAFPQVRFVVATHSPFVVTSEPNANVYALDYAGDSVSSTLLDFADKSASAESTLRDVLGVESTIPVWAERRYDEIVDRYSQVPMTAELLRSLRNELQESGLGSALPRVLDALLSPSEAASGGVGVDGEPEL
jgi:energy-coupling factor transporter ATP-binding protein EcfA2